MWSESLNEIKKVYSKEVESGIKSAFLIYKVKGNKSIECEIKELITLDVDTNP